MHRDVNIYVHVGGQVSKRLGSPQEENKKGQCGTDPHGSICMRNQNPLFKSLPKERRITSYKLDPRTPGRGRKGEEI